MSGTGFRARFHIRAAIAPRAARRSANVNSAASLRSIDTIETAIR